MVLYQSLPEIQPRITRYTQKQAWIDNRILTATKLRTVSSRSTIRDRLLLASSLSNFTSAHVLCQDVAFAVCALW